MFQDFWCPEIWLQLTFKFLIPEVDLDKHLERQYVQRKLTAGLSRIWQDVQTKVRLLVVAKEVGTRMNINDFLHLVNLIWLGAVLSFHIISFIVFWNKGH